MPLLTKRLRANRFYSVFASGFLSATIRFTPNSIYREMSRMKLHITLKKIVLIVWVGRLLSNAVHVSVTIFNASFTISAREIEMTMKVLFRF